MLRAHSPVHAVRAVARASRCPTILAALALLALPSASDRASIARLAEQSAVRENAVQVLTVNGVINPLTARYLERGLDDAARANAQLVVLRLDTPGGLESSMRTMAQTIMTSRIPVVVYVAPPGARAASAGMFITLAATIAAMAPGTNIGAAHPVGIGGQPDSVMTGKVVNDAAAFARALAAEHGRNAEWAESAVRHSVSITAEEALERNIIEIVAPDLEDLLRQIDGRSVTTRAGTMTLRTAGAALVEKPMRLTERILQVITDPDIAYLLFTLAMVGLVAELYHPGLILPGLTGAVSLILALVAFGSLPINWAGVLLLLMSVALVVAELHTQGGGVLGAGALVSFAIGSLLLYEPFGIPSPAAPSVRVNPWLVAGMTALMAAFFGLVIRALVRAQRAPVVTGMQALLGRIGVAVTNLDPDGQVRVDSEVWSAMADRGSIRAGDEIEVVDVQGVTLLVRRPLDW